MTIFAAERLYQQTLDGLSNALLFWCECVTKSCLPSNRAMKKFLLVAFLLAFALPVWATPQISDVLIYKGKSYSLYGQPLYSLYKTDTTKYLHLMEPAPFCNTACYRKYVAYWEIIGDELCLIRLSTPCESFEDSADLKSLFGEKYLLGSVKADWFTGVLNTAPEDANGFYYNYSGWNITYDKETDFHFEKGKLIKTENFTNAIKRSSYKDNDKVRAEFWKQNPINWAKLPKIDKDIRVFVSFSANAEGKIDSVQVIKGHSPPFDEEAIRLIKLIPEWEVIYKRGKHQRMFWRMLIMFRKEH